MLDAVGAAHVDDLYRHVPKDHLNPTYDGLPSHQGELEVERALSAYAARNHSAHGGPFFLGAGMYYHHIPAAVDHLIQRGEFLTAYTPYQPEVSQGTLASVFEFQSYIAALTGQEVANASMYDGATATAEAALMALRLSKGKKHHIHVASGLHPHYRGVLATYLTHTQGDIRDEEDGAIHLDDDSACIIVQSPTFNGDIVDLAPYRAACDRTGAQLIVVVNEILALGMLPAPTCADIVVGEAQSLGIPMSFGGPGLGFFATKHAHVRQIPGRLCGETVDEDGKISYVLTLNTREQHIRRERATSNICTNQGLCALAFTIHLSLLGEVGFKHLAQLNHAKACQLADALAQVEGVNIVSDTFFNEFTIRLPKAAQSVHDALIKRGIIAGLVTGEHTLLLAATEMTTDADIAALTGALEEVLS